MHEMWLRSLLVVSARCSLLLARDAIAWTSPSMLCTYGNDVNHRGGKFTTWDGACPPKLSVVQSVLKLRDSQVGYAWLAR